jgi:hypothetical protein
MDAMNACLIEFFGKAKLRQGGGGTGLYSRTIDLEQHIPIPLPKAENGSAGVLVTSGKNSSSAR